MELRTPFGNNDSNCYLTVKLDGYRYIVRTYNITKMMHFIKYFKEKYFDKDKTKVKIVKQKTEVKKEELTKEELTAQMIDDYLREIFVRPFYSNRTYSLASFGSIPDDRFSVRYGYDSSPETPVTEPTVVQFSGIDPVTEPPPNIIEHVMDNGLTISYITNPIIDD